VVTYLSKDGKFYRDLAERAAWAGLWAVLSVVSVEQLGLPAYVVPFAVVALSAAKSAVLRHVAGEPNSASTIKGV
jgi:hypothetical protein